MAQGRTGYLSHALRQITKLIMQLGSTSLTHTIARLPSFPQQKLNNNGISRSDKYRLGV